MRLYINCKTISLKINIVVFSIWLFDFVYFGTLVNSGIGIFRNLVTWHWVVWHLANFTEVFVAPISQKTRFSSVLLKICPSNIVVCALPCIRLLLMKVRTKTTINLQEIKWHVQLICKECCCMSGYDWRKTPVL